MQSVMNRLVKLIYSLPPGFLTTSYLIELGSLSRQELSFRICLLPFEALKFDEPRYLADLLRLENVHLSMVLKTSDDSLRLELPRATSE